MPWSFIQMFPQEKSNISFGALHMIQSASREAAREDSQIKSSV